MTIRRDLLSWQLTGYAAAHRARANLILHVFSVPLCWIGTALIVAGVVLSNERPVAIGIAFWLIARLLQGRGHRGERTPPQPFLGPLDFVSRFVVEQLVTFPRFVLGGGFARAWRAFP